MSHQETTLLTEYKASGDIQLLAKLYQPYMPLVYGLCLKYFKNEEQSQDAVMEIFEELIQKLKIHSVTHFKSWLYSYARNYCLMYLRKNAAHQHVVIEDYENSISERQETTFDWEKEQNLQYMEICLQQLSPEQSLCVRLFYLEQYCYKDIAVQTGFDMNQVKSFIQNGKRNLKNCMEKQRHGN
jgi:RNA polymerase sigma factor (sigma-70 family)